MNVADLIKLLPAFLFPSPPGKGFVMYVPLKDLIDVFERNDILLITGRELHELNRGVRPPPPTAKKEEYSPPQISIKDFPEREEIEVTLHQSSSQGE